jgi:hypothetical protein
VAERPPIRLLSHTGPGTWGWCIIGHPLPYFPPEPEGFEQVFVYNNLVTILECPILALRCITINGMIEM